MSYGLQLSASGLFTALHRQDVFTNNLANMDSVGFKPLIPSTTFRRSVAEEDNLPRVPGDELLRRLGGGTMLLPERVDFAQGSIRMTSSPLDIAIEGEGFLQVESSGMAGKTLLTRDGRMTRNNENELVMTGTGMRVLDEGGSPIELEGNGEIKIGADGRIEQNGEVVARLGFVAADTSSIRPIGHGVFEAPQGTQGRAAGEVRQHAVEESGVDEVRALMEMTNSSREVEANVDLMRAHDRLSQRAIEALGRVTG
ncbi:MAG: flagellar hook-basal body complex protein [Phycisphaerales bacterium]